MSFTGSLVQQQQQWSFLGLQFLGLSSCTTDQVQGGGKMALTARTRPPQFQAVLRTTCPSEQRQNADEGGEKDPVRLLIKSSFRW